MRSTRQARRDASRLWRACLTNGSPDATRVRELVDQLLESDRSGAPAILAQLLRLVRVESARRAARVESAAPLDAADRAAVQAAVARSDTGVVDTAFAVDPALIGGMRVTVGSHVYDGSIRARLAALDASF